MDCACQTEHTRDLEKEKDARGHDYRDHEQTKIFFPRRPKRQLIGDYAHNVGF